MYLIIDVETTGLPDRSWLPFGCMPDYRDLSKYDGARIVQWSYMLCYVDFTEKELKDVIIKTDGFKITNTEFHGITESISLNQGMTFTEAANEFAGYLDGVSHIIAHNMDFDINVILSECHRYGLESMIEKFQTKQLVCTMKATKQLVKARNQYGIKYPSLAELYRYVCKEDLQNAHNSKYDVINLHKICTLIKLPM